MADHRLNLTRGIAVDKVISEYQSYLNGPQKVFGCTYEKHIQAIEGDEQILRWKQYLSDRYLVPCIS